MAFLAFCNSVRTKRMACGFLPVIVCVIAVGCSSSSDSPYELAPVTGTVKFKDGTVPQGTITSISFHPINVKQQGKFKVNTAGGNLDEDGNFELKTDGEEGAVVGRHKVVIKIIRKYPPPVNERNKPVIHPKYEDKSTTPLEVDVKSGKNHFTLEVKKP